MRTTYMFLQILFCIALSAAHPKAYEKLKPHRHVTAETEQAKNQSDGSSTNFEPTRTTASNVRHLQRNSEMQDAQRPRFLATYGNVYKPNPQFLSPVDPFQNILLYFLLNFGRELSQNSLEENRLRRPLDFSSDPRSANKVSTQDKPMQNHAGDDQTEEVHFLPHVGGTCMCFNNRQSRKDKVMIDEQNYCQSVNTHTADSKTENHDVPSSNNTEKSTAAAHNKAKNNTIIKVLRLGRRNKTSNLETTTTAIKNSTKDEIVITGEEIVVDVQLTPDFNRQKHKHKKKSKESDAVASSIKSNTSAEDDTIQHASNKSKRDESYYFLSSSGGTDQRTTAPNKLNVHMPGTNTIPAQEKKQVRNSKKRRKRARRYLKKVEKYVHENLKRERTSEITTMKASTDHINETEQKEATHAVEQSDNRNVMLVMLPMARMEEPTDDTSDVQGVTNLRSAEEIIKYHNWAPIQQELKSKQPLRAASLIPTLLGVGTFLLILAYVMKTKGSCHNLFSNSNRPNLVAAESKTIKEMKT